MRKKVYILASIVMAMSLMTACGSTETAEVTTEAVTEAVTEEATEEVTEEETEEVTEEDTEEIVEASGTDGEEEYPVYSYTGDDGVLNAISFFICDELAKGYTDGAIIIPEIIEVSRDDSDSSDIKVWGDFFIYTYDVNGDVLECVAGGTYPGCMHVATADTDCGYEVKEFELCEDGSEFDPSAKEIFGERYDAFMEVYSNDELKEEKRGEFIAEYVKSNSIPVTKYKDYGWDPIDIPLGDDSE